MSQESEFLRGAELPPTALEPHKAHLGGRTTKRPRRAHGSHTSFATPGKLLSLSGPLSPICSPVSSVDARALPVEPSGRRRPCRACRCFPDRIPFC